MTRVSIDHMGLIGRGGSIDPDALQKLRALSKHKNLFIKISGFHSQGAKTPPYHDLRLAATQIIQHFGADRCMWGSDGPYQFLPPHSLVDSLDFIDSLRISPVEKDAVFGGTAHNLYFSKK
jgi:predicted TIM-barrel fold metal-dependent hydrolase